MAPIMHQTRLESESRFHRWCFLGPRILGRYPRLEMTAAPLAQQILALLPKLCAYSATQIFIRFLVGSTNYARRHRGLANSTICFYLLRQRRDLISSPPQDGFAVANLGHRPRN